MQEKMNGSRRERVNKKTISSLKRGGKPQENSQHKSNSHRWVKIQETEKGGTSVLFIHGSYSYIRERKTTHLLP